jgi:hypothetical protein
VTTETIRLLDDGAEIASIIHVSGDEVTLTSPERPSLLADYTLRVAERVSGLGGTPMLADFSATFRVTWRLDGGSRGGMDAKQAALDSACHFLECRCVFSHP